MAAGFSLPFAVKSVYRFSTTFDPQVLAPIDVIVCLAGARGRIPAAADLWARYRVQGQHPILYLSGMGPKADFNVFSLQLNDTLKGQIHREDVYIESESVNTVQNAEWFLKIAQEKRWKSGVLLTSDYHIKRAYHIFRSLSQSRQQELQLYTWATKSESADFQEQFRVSFLEFVKGVYYMYWWRP